MKRIISIVVIVFILITTSLAATVTIIQPSGSVSMTNPVGVRIDLLNLSGLIRWWKVLSGGVTIEDGSFTMPNNNVSIQPMYTGGYITVTQSAGGTITPGSTGVEEGGSQTFNITPNDGYTISELIVDGNSIAAANTYTFSDVRENHTITARFEAGSSVLYGDANDDGSVNIQDSTVILNYLRGNSPTINLVNANVNLDGVVDIYDNAIIYRYIMNEITTLPYEGEVVVFLAESEDITGEYQLFTTGETKALAPSGTLTKDGYVLAGWTTTAGGTTVDYELGANYTANDNATLYAVWEEVVVVNADTSGANAPVIATGLTPVNWNGSEWVTTDEANWQYNYNTVAEATHSRISGNGDAAWANAQTSDGSLYVWIPRYTYMIESGYHSDVDSWNSLDTSGTGKILIQFSNGTNDTVTEDVANASEGYIAHPAFNFGGTPLKGIWVAKYEASRNDATESSAGTGTTVSSKPGVVSWRSTTVSDMFNYAYNLNRSLESHLMKNVEWGAVAYLTNAIGRIPYINNSSSYITGNSGASQDASEASGVTNAWNTANGVKASTTHNVYGIYDMSGGAYEYVAAYLNNGNSALSSYASNLVSSYGTYGTKYVDVYPIGTSDTYANNYAAWSNITGDAVYETSSSGNFGSGSWDGDYSGAPYASLSVFVRGGRYNSTSKAGLFNFNTYGAGGSHSAISFRPVFSIQ